MDALEDVLEGGLADGLPEVSEVVADCLANVAVQPLALTAAGPPVLTGPSPREDEEEELPVRTMTAPP